MIPFHPFCLAVFAALTVAGTTLSVAVVDEVRDLQVEDAALALPLAALVPGYGTMIVPIWFASPGPE